MQTPQLSAKVHTIWQNLKSITISYHTCLSYRRQGGSSITGGSHVISTLKKFLGEEPEKHKTDTNLKIPNRDGNRRVIQVNLSSDLAQEVIQAFMDVGLRPPYVSACKMTLYDAVTIQGHRVKPGSIVTYSDLDEVWVPDKYENETNLNIFNK